MEEQRLPSHHQLYTALIPSSPPQATPAIAGITSGPEAAESTDREPSSAERSNWRQQLLTLHVIFPSLLLPALDLLDRGLVTRLLVASGSQTAPEAETPPHVGISKDGEAEPTQRQEQFTMHPFTNQLETDSKHQICMYVVQSVASTTSRRKRHTTQAPRTYAVHLSAWSCSCGAFALDAYAHQDVTTHTEQPPDGIPPEWFGSLGLNRRLGLEEDFPCCKHLLACLLAEKWRKTSGGHVEGKCITKEELATIIGGPY
ncbi:hypothetical protein TARUN_1598 [Trichoderma arundinaceum]|uniref:SWIM-type domain-containing protein n=1 Tax=Trichoderma arundinaceum TaxID=490622 RepID=A0A395NWZ7_TRIAR|nr:hypothetical protein TARUN_1598 [Trichoderma arundinaceum]